MRLRVIALQTVRKECSSRPWALRTRSAYMDPARTAREDLIYMSSDLQFSAYPHTKNFQDLDALHPDERRHGPTNSSATYTTVISLDLLVISLMLLVSAHCWTPKSSSCTVCLMLDPTIKYVSSANFTKMLIAFRVIPLATTEHVLGNNVFNL